jgi:hypothetical protein
MLFLREVPQPHFLTAYTAGPSLRLDQLFGAQMPGQGHV